jgi:NADH-quinone oxidoreductase subunit M
VVLGIFAFSLTSLQGASLQMISHGVSTGGLFLLVGMLYERRHTRLIEDFGGLGAIAPIFGGIFLIVALSSLGLPGLNGFVGEFLVLIGTFTAHRLWAIIGSVGVILAAVYLLWAYQRVWHGPVLKEENRHILDLDRREKLVMAPVLAMIVLIGVYPKPFLDRMGPSLSTVVQRVQQANPNSTLESQGGK